MSRRRDEPLVARNFLVRLTLQGPRGGHAGTHELACTQVVFPPLRLDRRPVRDGTDPGDRPESEANPNLVLRRGHTGSPELYEWWRAERDRERDRVREVTVILLDEDLQQVTGWHFTGCHIVSLDYAPLDALDLGVFTESLELSFKTIEQISFDG